MKERDASLWITAVVVFPFAELNIPPTMKRAIKQVHVVAFDNLLSFVRNYPENGRD